MPEDKREYDIFVILRFLISFLMNKKPIKNTRPRPNLTNVIIYPFDEIFLMKTPIDPMSMEAIIAAVYPIIFVFPTVFHRVVKIGDVPIAHTTLFHQNQV